MKTFNRLVEEIVFESGATGDNNIDTTAGLILDEVMDTLAGKQRYPELLVTGRVVEWNGTPDQGVIQLPDDVQFLIEDRLVFAPGGVTDQAYSLLRKMGALTLLNTGGARYYYRAGNYLYVTPTADLTAQDFITIDYYRFPRVRDNGSIIPESLTLAAKELTLARLRLTLGTKGVAEAMKLGRDAYIDSTSQIDLPPQN